MTDDRDLDDIPAHPEGSVPPIYVACDDCGAAVGVDCDDDGPHGARYVAAGWIEEADRD